MLKIDEESSLFTEHWVRMYQFNGLDMQSKRFYINNCKTTLFYFYMIYYSTSLLYLLYVYDYSVFIYKYTLKKTVQ